jgi:endonuclease/exonuclease/phosphatase family metal-dependent hydrolase
MKIISLNTWGGKIFEPLIVFLKDNASDTDIFCFQEVLAGGSGQTSRGEMKSLYEDISNILINHLGYFSEYGEGGYYSENSKNLDFKYGIAIFVKKEHRQSFVEGITLYDSGKKWTDYNGRFAAGASIAVNVLDFTIINVHGLWQGGGKKDTEARLEQSKRIINLASKIKERKIICGDFNLKPDTESIKILEQSTINLVKKFGITSTRSSLYTKPERFADCILVSSNIKVNHFEVLKDEVSDHLPLLLKYE